MAALGSFRLSASRYDGSCPVVATQQDFRNARHRSALRVSFGDDCHFVNPLYLKEVKALILNACHLCRNQAETPCGCGQALSPSVGSLSCLVRWKFQGPFDSRLLAFKDAYRPVSQLSFVELQDAPDSLFLLPQQVRHFLEAHRLDDSTLEALTLNFQHYPRGNGKRDFHDYYADALFQDLEALRQAAQCGSCYQALRSSARIQTSLARRLGLAKEPDDEGVLQTEADALEDEEQDLGSAPPRPAAGPTCLLDELRGFCSERTVLRNSFGNIIINAGTSSIIGGRLPCVVVSSEAARLLPCWDHAVPGQDRLLAMLAAGPAGDGGAWTLHLSDNSAAGVPSDLGGLGAAKDWLERLLRRGRRVTAVQRHARTGDLVAAARHPLVQPVPHYQLLVSSKKTGVALSMPPACASYSNLDFDGDKMKVACERSELRRELLEELLSAPKLRLNALGDRALQLSGSAPLALNAAQRHGDAAVSPSGLSRFERSDALDDRQKNGAVVWRGVTEAVYDAKFFFDGLAAVGNARPSLLASCWSAPLFEEVRFQAQDLQGRWRPSRDTSISFDGFYPVPREYSDCQKREWIKATLTRHKDLFKELQQPFVVKLCGSTPPRRSSLDGFTFAQLRSLVQAQTRRNLLGDTVVVMHLPGLVERGCFLTRRRPSPCPWQRMARVLLRLGRLRPSTPELGHDAIVAGMLRYSWRPSADDVRYQLQQTKADRGAWPDGLPPLRSTEELRDASGCAGGLEEAGYLAAAQMLRRFGRAYADLPGELVARREDGSERELFVMTAKARWERLELSEPEPRRIDDAEELGPEEAEETRVGCWTRRGRELDVTQAKALWERLDLSQLCCIEAESLDPEDVEETSIIGWTHRLRFVRRRMEQQDWDALRRLSCGVGRLRQRRASPLRTRATRADDAEQRQVLLDWCRLVGAARARERHTAEVQATLEALPRLVCDDHAFFQAQSALQALGEALAHVVLPQPEQSQMLLTEDAYARAANLALDEARARLFALRANEVECDFSELRQQVIDLLKAVSVAIANGHHEGKLGHVLRVTGLLAVDWSQPADQLRVSGVAAGADGVYRAVACDTRRGLADGEPARFCCWSWEADDPGDREPVLSRLLLCRVVASHRRAGLLQFALPVTSEEAASRAGLHASQLKPLRPGLWGCRRAALLAEEGSLELGEPASDLRSGLFAWEHRLYVKVDGGWRLAPLPSQPQGRGRVWQLVSPEGKLFDPYNTPFDAEPCAPPCTPPFAENGPVQLRPGPDSRLQRALRLLTEAPEQLYASPLVHCCGGEASTGLPFLVGNLAAPKKAAATLLRMPVFGAGFGVRSSMGEPLGGRELSAEVLGSAPRSFTSVQANESRRVRRTGNNEKEITALWNKKATQKASTARVTPEGSVEGALMLDGHCRALRPEDGLPCMGCLARNLACRRCGRAYVGEAEVRGLYRAKRLLEDAGPLRLAKKLRRLAFPSVRHGLLRGNQVRSLRDCFDGGRAENAEAAVTRLPEGFRLSRDRQAAAAYPGVVYVLDGRDLLAPARPSHLAAELLAKDACWTLPPGHAILVERTSCPRETPTNASTSSTLLDEAEWAELRQRCTLLGGGDAALGPGAKREPGAKPEPAAKREPGAKPEPAAKPEPGVKPEPGAKREQEQEPGVAGLAERATAEDDFYSDDELFASPSVKLSSRFDAALRRQISARKALAATATQSKQGHWGHQFDVALVDLDFVVLLVAGASFRGLPFLERTEFGGGLARSCPKCLRPSTLALLRNASEAEACLVARRFFQGSLSSLCDGCLRLLRADDEKRASSVAETHLQSEEERANAVVLELRRADVKNRLRLYRVFHWLNCVVDGVRLGFHEGRSFFVLPDVDGLASLSQALDRLRGGELRLPSQTVLAAHYSNPVDEALSFQNGTRTFMKTMETQPFLATHGGKRELLAALQVRHPCLVEDRWAESVVGNVTPGRWQRGQAPRT